MREKLWSPGKERKCWIIWYEDDEGPGDKSVYTHKLEAHAHLQALVNDLASSELKELDPEDDDYAQSGEVLRDILDTVRKDPVTAFSLWEEYRDNFSIESIIHFEEGRLFGA